MMRRWVARRAARRRFQAELQVQYAAAVLKIEAQWRAWYRGEGPEPQIHLREIR